MSTRFLQMCHWLSLIEFAVEIREHVEVRAMTTRLGFSLIAFFVRFFLKSQAELEGLLLDPFVNVSFILM